MKPHGSINWCSGKTYYSQDLLPETHVVRALPAQMGKSGYKPAVIFGHRNKLSAEGPFLRLFSHFREDLMRTNDELVIIGYSFRDHHVNESIATWFNSRSTRTITLVTPNKKWAKQSEFAGILGRLAKPGGRVIVHQGTAKDAIPELFPTAES